MSNLAKRTASACEAAVDDISKSPTSMAKLDVEVAIIGGGLAGAILALCLARAGRKVAVFDLAPACKPVFRCEGLKRDQAEILCRLGLREMMPPSMVDFDRAAGPGFRYEALVNAIRSLWPPSVRLVVDRVTDVTEGGDRQLIISRNGEIASARLAVLATGVGPDLLKQLGLTRRVISENHSVSIGFNLRRRDSAPWEPDNFVHRGERPGDRIGYASFARVGSDFRANLFCFHQPTDPWMREAGRDPLKALLKAAPNLAPAVEGLEAAGPADVWVTTLYRTEGVRRSGMVVIGDAFQTSCPATTFGVTRLLTDIERLMAYLPHWLATPGMDEGKIAQFYADPAKRAVDQFGLARAQRDRAFAVNTTLFWRAFRSLRDLKFAVQLQLYRRRSRKS